MFNSKIARTLKGMKCNRIKFGVQAINGKIRRDLMSRYETNRKIDEALEVCESLGLPYYVDHIFTPYDSERGSMKAALYYAKKRLLAKIVIYNLSYFPNTPLFNNAVKKGELAGKEIDFIEEGIGQMYYAKEGVGKEKTFRNFMTYGSLYRLIPILNPGQVKFLVRLNVHKFLGKLPGILLIFLDATVVLFRRDRIAWNWIVSMARNYISCIFRKEVRKTLPDRCDGVLTKRPMANGSIPGVQGVNTMPRPTKRSL